MLETAAMILIGRVPIVSLDVLSLTRTGVWRAKCGTTLRLVTEEITPFALMLAQGRGASPEGRAASIPSGAVPAKEEALAKREMIRRRSQLGIPLRGMERTGCLNLTRIERMIPLAIIRRRVYSSRTESGFLQYPRDCVRNSVKTRYRLIRRRVGGGMFSGRDDTTDRRENPGTSNEDAAQKTVKEKNQAAARHANRVLLIKQGRAFAKFRAAGIAGALLSL